MAASPVGQAAEVRPALAFEGAGKEQQRGGPPAVSVVGQMFNFTPFFFTHWRSSQREREEHKTQQNNVWKAWSNRNGDPSIVFYLVCLAYFESKTSQPYLKRFKKESVEFSLTGLIGTSLVFRLSTHVSLQTCRTTRCCEIYHFDEKIRFWCLLSSTNIYFTFLQSGWFHLIVNFLFFSVSFLPLLQFSMMTPTSKVIFHPS